MALPYTRGCFVCGRDNDLGLQLRFSFDAETGEVSSQFMPTVAHIGFAGVVHGGVVSTVLDEGMTWAVSASAKRFFFAVEISVRFRLPIAPDIALTVCAQMTQDRRRVLEATSSLLDPDGQVHASAIGKYMPIPSHRYEELLSDFVADENTIDPKVFMGGGNSTLE